MNDDVPMDDGPGPPGSEDAPAVAEAASAIASGEPVDWPTLESSLGDAASREVLQALERVAGIAAFHRSLPGAPATPAAEPQSTWGTLTIVREIGRGSFGRVYLAWDPRLDREVALKILDRGLISDSPQGRAVVEEGKHLARLRHPNIVSIHGAEWVDGRVGLEMELVTGRTLSEIVRTEGPFGADEAMLVGRDVGRALAAVHRAGLVHRDVKAQNVIREHGGRIVLMDFGAGQQAEALPSAEVAGTPLYLAPEVLAGSAPTPRSDLYSLGVLLYYLVTGSFPVQAGTIEELRAAHLAGQTTRLRDARPDLPERFIQLVERALAPDPANRADSAGSFEAELSQALGHADRAAAPASGARRWALVAGIAAMVAIGASTWALWPQHAPVQLIERFILPLDGHLTMPTGLGSREFALSPDGSRLAYATMTQGRRGSHVVVRRLDEVEPRVIENTGDAGQPFFSPDGASVGLVSGGRLITIALPGGAPVAVTDVRNSGGASWGRDRTIVFSSQRNLWRVAETGGTPTRLTTVDPGKDEVAIRPQALATGDVLFTLRQNAGATTAVAVLTRVGPIKILVPNATGGKYMPPGYLVFVTGDPPGIKATPFDLRRLEITGAAVQVQALKSPAHWFDVSESGSLVYSLPDEPDPQHPRGLVWLDRLTGRDEPLTLPLVPGQYLAYSLRLSPDARRVAVATTPNVLLESVDAATPGPLKVGDLERGTFAPPLTKDAVRPLAWSSDGTRITYRTADGAIAWRRADGAGPEAVLAAPRPDLDCNTGEWSPDGRVLLLRCNEAGSDLGRGFMALSFPSADAVGRSPVVPEPFLPSMPGAGPPRFSRDGRWIAYSANIAASSGAAVYVQAFPGTGAVSRISTEIGRRPVWRGNELFFLTPRGLQVASVRTQPTFGFDPPHDLFDDFSAYDVAGTGGLTFEASLDGRRFLVLKGQSGGGDFITKLTIVLHWIEDVTRQLNAR
jgi:serine/threonine-protein kinase